MRSWSGLGVSALAVAACAVVLAAVPAAAQNLDVDEMAAALALPVITGEFQGNVLKGSLDVDVFTSNNVITFATITNGRASPVLLKLDVISGDVLPGPDNGPPLESDGDHWQSLSFECELTGRETTTFVFMPPAADRDLPSDDGDDGLRSSELYVECSDGDDTDGAPKALHVKAEVGILFVAAADPVTGEAIGEDVLFGDAVVVDYAEGNAASFEAIAFQAGSGVNDGNKVYRFDNSEYASFPAVLATNFISHVDDNIETELFLFTLDGTTGNVPVPRVRLGGIAYDDDEEFFDFQWEFDCLDIVQLVEIDQNFAFLPEDALGLGSMSGHLMLVPQPVATDNDSHDAEHGDGNDVRRRAVHGWILQAVEDGNRVIYEDHPIEDTPIVDQIGTAKSSWGRPLGQARTALIPFLADRPATLDADPLE